MEKIHTRITNDELDKNSAKLSNISAETVTFSFKDDELLNER